jgi:hypothetical protein
MLDPRIFFGYLFPEIVLFPWIFSIQKHDSKEGNHDYKGDKDNRGVAYKEVLLQCEKKT